MPVYAAFKRAADFVLAIISLAILLPFFAIIAIAIRLDSPGRAFFRQKRTGKDGKEFYIYKFRTMPQIDHTKVNGYQNQHTKVGLFLRKTSLDELPQLINIIRGEMAFIGPRPWVVEYYANMNNRERERTKVRPGLTGLAQVKGRNNLTVFEKINYDLEYVANYSLRQDVKILFATVKIVLTHAGAVAKQGHIPGELSALQAENAANVGLRATLSSPKGN